MKKLFILGSTRGLGKEILKLAINEDFEICCGEGSIKVLSIQREGKKVQKIKEFLLGSKINKGTNIS